jgi:hypothetical protein
VIILSILVLRILLDAKPCYPYRDNKRNNVFRNKLLEEGNMMVEKKEKYWQERARVYFLEVGFQEEYPITSRKCP